MHIISKLRSLFTIDYYSKQLRLYYIGLRIFQVGVLFLAAAPAISFLLLFCSSILGSFYREKIYLEDKYNYPLIAVSFLMIINCLFISMNKNIYSLDLANIWIGLSNWLPFFFCFWGFQPFLKSQELRIKTAKFLIFGSLPVLASGFCQYFLKMYGPYNFFNNLIVWYQRPINNQNGVTGLFNNQNYAGAWLSIVLPLCLFFLIRNNKKNLNTLMVFFLNLSFVYMIVLTTSRGAILSVFTSIFLLAKSIKNKFIVIISLITIPITLNLISLIPLNFQSLIYKYLPFELIKKTSLVNISNINIFPRIEIWSKSFDFIKSNLFFGYGAGSFESLYKFSNGKFGDIQHSHNIFLEIAINHGLPSSLIIFSTLILLIFHSWRKSSISINRESFKNQTINFDKAWIISFITFFLIHVFDITYFDGRISTTAWLLLAGMRSIINEGNNEQLSKN